MSENKEAFFKRLYPFFGPSILKDIELASILAKHAHRAQVRKAELNPDGSPVRYFEHIRRVALILLDEVKCIRPEMVIAAILHDAIEDTRELTPEMIEHCFNSEIVGIVKILSKDPKEGYLDRFRVCVDWRPYLIKACDRLDNLRSMENTPLSFRKKQVLETETHYFPLFDRMLQLVPEEFKFGAMKVRDLVRQETEKLKQGVLVEQNRDAAFEIFDEV